MESTDKLPDGIFAGKQRKLEETEKTKTDMPEEQKKLFAPPPDFSEFGKQDTKKEKVQNKEAKAESLETPETDKRETEEVPEIRYDEHSGILFKWDEDDEQNDFQKSTKSRAGKNIVSAILMTAQGISSGCLLWKVWRLNIFPLKYIIVAIAVLAVLFIVLCTIMARAKKKWKTAVAVILSAAITVAVCCGIGYLNETEKFKKKAFGSAARTETTTYLVIARKGKYSSVNQLAGKTTETGPENSIQDMAIDKLKKKVKTKIIPVTGYDTLDSDLMKDRTDSILVEDSAMSILNETDKGFSEKAIILMRIKVPRKSATAASYVGEDKPFTVFVSGSDSRGGVTETARSDVDMLLTVNPEKKQLLMTSIPRDSFVTIHGKNAKDKLTHAGLLGINTLLETVRDFMNVKIDYYLKVNFKSVTTLVDELGGIDVYSDRDIRLWTYPGHKNKPLSKGWHHMNGKLALAFARERHSYKSGDRHRAQNQQAVLKAIAGKLMSAKTLTNYSDILASINSMFITDIPDSLISSLVEEQFDSPSDSWSFLSYVVSCSEKKMTGGYFMPNRSLYYAIPSGASVQTARNKIMEIRDESAESSENIAGSDDESNGTDDISGSDTGDQYEEKPITQQEAAI